MIDQRVIINKLNELNKYLKHLRKYEGTNKEELENDLDKLWSVERGLQLCIQIILDIGNHILSEKGITVENYSDIFRELRRLEVITESLESKIGGMAGFRNILVHEYAEVDTGIIEKVLNNNLDDFKEFAEHIIDYLE